MHIRSLAFAAASLFTLSATALTPFSEWKHGRVQLKEVSIHFRYAGRGPPLFLVHGNPQYSLTWYLIGPILAQDYTVITIDNRGAGDSSIPRNNNYTATSMAADLKGVIDFLKINQTFVFGHDKGVGPSTALAIQYPNLVKALGVAEYPLPGFGYELAWNPAPNWDLYQNWQLAFFSVPDAAEFFIRGREKEMLSWYFFHASYSGPLSVPTEILEQYTNSISKPGFLRAMFQPFAVDTVLADSAFFNQSISRSMVVQPLLVLGGEASFAPAGLVQQFWGPIGKNITVDIVPKAGHWIADENPTWVAQRIDAFFKPFVNTVPAVDLSYLDNKVTLSGGFQN